MSAIHVTFDADRPQAHDTRPVDFPITVEVSEALFENNGGNLTDMTDEDKAEFDAFILDVTPRDAIDAALEIIATAPGFDAVPRDEVDCAGVTATVRFANIER